MKAIKVGLLIDGTGRAPFPNCVVLIEGATIQAVVPQNEADSLMRGVEVIEATNGLMMPGLIDAHVHLGDPMVSNAYAYSIETPPTLAVFREAHSAQRALAAGFTTLRNMGSLEGVSLRKAIDARLIPGPRVLTSGRVLMTGGHTDKLLPANLPRPYRETADGVEEVRRRVREHISAGADFIKFEATGGMVETVKSYTPAEIEAIVDEAHALGVRVAAHAHIVEGIHRAINAGADTLEHGTFLDDECAGQMARSGMYFVPTMARLYDGLARASELGLSPAMITNFRHARDTRLKALDKAHRAGVKIVLGTNASNKFAPHGRNAIELVALADAGLSPMECLMAGTSVAAQALNLSSSVGTIEKGKKADLLLVRSNPLDNVALLQDPTNILSVWKDGEKVIERREDGRAPAVQWAII